MNLFTVINKHPPLRYLIVGGSSFLVDLWLLFLLYQIIGLHISIATTIAYWITVVYNFTLTRRWTFSIKQTRQLQKHILLYAVLLGFNYLTTVTILLLTENYLHYAFVKAAIVALQTVWNYPVYRYFIFKK